MADYHCNLCGWSGPESETKSNASCKHGCPVCWWRRAQFIPTAPVRTTDGVSASPSFAVEEKQEPMPDFTGWV